MGFAPQKIHLIAAERCFSLLLIFFGTAVGCGQSATLGTGANPNFTQHAPGEQKNLVVKKGVGALDSPDRGPLVDPKPTQVPNPSAEPAEAEIADIPRPITGAFLTDFLACWLNITPSTTDPYGGDPENTRIGCGLLTNKGERSSTKIPLDQWRIYSQGHMVIDTPIPGISASQETFWSVVFTLPTSMVSSTKIAIKNDPTKVLPIPEKYMVLDLGDGKSIGGALNFSYFRLGGGRRRELPGCKDAAKKVAWAQPAVSEIYVPITVSSQDRSHTKPKIGVMVFGLCGINSGDGYGPPTLTFSRKGTGVVPDTDLAKLDRENNIIPIELPAAGDYEVTIKATKKGNREADDVGVRDFLIVPLLGNLTAEPIGVR